MMNLQPEKQWWNGKARAKLPDAVLLDARRWQSSRHSETVQQFDKRSRLKVSMLFIGFLLVMLVYRFVPIHVSVTVCAVLVLGTFFIPYTRIFMHSQMHWGLGGGPISRFLLGHFVSLLFSVPQTGYSFGHRMHHRFDNDLDSNGRPKDLQSTYIFSRGSKPTHPLLWIPYYIFVFQHLITAFLVLHKGNGRERLWFMVELGAIVIFHFTLWVEVPIFYLSVYLPALFLAWIGSAVVLYMMHAVDAEDYIIHPTNTSISPFFNRFGDNDGYHIEHTLFPGVHPLYLPRLHAVMDLDPRQILREHYVVAGIKYLLGVKRKEHESEANPYQH
jgi:fatty acid desaturase